MALEPITTLKHLLQKAHDAERSEDYLAAASAYENAIKVDVLSEQAYNRLMIVYRKLKDYKKELRVINDGIKAYERFYKSRATKSKKIADISSKLNLSVGLIDKKGNAAYEPEPIATWKKRKLLVEKKLSTSKK